MFGIGLTRHLKVRGVVAEHCSYCNGPRPMEVVDSFLAFHVLYVIRLGDGSLMSTTVRCPQCGSSFGFAPQAYDFIMPVEAAQALPFATLMYETNQRLATAIPPGQAAREIAIMPAQAVPPTFEPKMLAAEARATDVVKEMKKAEERDARLQSAYALLDPHISNRQARPLFLKLDRWAASSPAERDALIAQIEAFAAHGAGEHRLEKFVAAVSWSYPQYWGCLAALLAYAAALSLLVWWPATRSWLWTPLIIVFGFAPTLAAFGLTQSWSIRRWCRKVLLPRAAAAGIDPDDVTSYLAGVDQQNQNIGERVREMARDVNTIASEVARLTGVAAANVCASDSEDDDAAEPQRRTADPEQLHTLQRMYIMRRHQTRLDRKTHWEKIAAAIRTVPVQVLPPEFDDVMRNWDIQPPATQTGMFNLAKVWLDERLLSEQLLVIGDIYKRTKPPGSGVWIWLAGVGACSVWPWLVTATRHWAWGPLAMLASMVAWAVLAIVMGGRRLHRRWLKLPKLAEARGVDFEILADVAEIDVATTDERGQPVREDVRKALIAELALNDFQEKRRKKRDELGVTAFVEHATRVREQRESSQ